MSLYHEAAAVVSRASDPDSGSIQSIVFGKKDWKSPPKTLFALSSQSVKWSRVLKDVIDQSDLLRSERQVGIAAGLYVTFWLTERQLSPALALVLTYDLLLAKSGIALPQNHGLALCISRHKARLNAELIRARLRERCSSNEALQHKLEQEALEDEATGSGALSKTKHPRWIRVNRILSSLDEQLSTTFASYHKVGSVSELFATGHTGPLERRVYHDEHIPNLLAVSTSADIATSKAYKEGKIIFQDKASCFPAYLLQYNAELGVAIDACAAPGNKTTHLAAIASEQLKQSSDRKHSIIACEKDPLRSQTLTKMVKTAGADKLVHVKSKQNFLKLDPNAKDFASVTALLLDPSCSGSGIVGRDEGGVTVYLPAVSHAMPSNNQSKKRKRDHVHQKDTIPDMIPESPADTERLQARLQSLSEFQLRLLLHAMSFPAATRITYSTCSVHAIENEDVVCQALNSDIARDRGWSIMQRKDQVDGMQRWHVRGDALAVKAYFDKRSNLETPSIVDIAEACIRCEKSGDDGTMGFFVAGFVRDPTHPPTHNGSKTVNGSSCTTHDGDDWDGFDDD